MGREIHPFATNFKSLTWRLATSPTCLVPSSAKATTDGVVLAPKQEINEQDGVLKFPTFSVLDNFWVARLHDCDAGVGGAQIDSNNSKKLAG